MQHENTKQNFPRAEYVELPEFLKSLYRVESEMLRSEGEDSMSDDEIDDMVQLVVYGNPSAALAENERIDAGGFEDALCMEPDEESIPLTREQAEKLPIEYVIEHADEVFAELAFEHAMTSNVVLAYEEGRDPYISCMGIVENPHHVLAERIAA